MGGVVFVGSVGSVGDFAYWHCGIIVLDREIGSKRWDLSFLQRFIPRFQQRQSSIMVEL
ncbi:MAG: hypothetical protein F6K22_15200 [Okeania sp. SIO2F4]|uniref:hypothetical protein n=1 Tax=Okeania sp. SIO2F4 TaxID=2607790 RepID=UPI001428F089|nr:hypothetical protein [Okeania sp. SIO2F4]NES04060.1 hypothetical protein [Okeania sp. SIO2F4]